MSFKQSRDIQMQIVPVIEKIMSNSNTAGMFDDLFAPGTGKSSSVKRGAASKNLVNNLLENHFEEICVILSLMNGISVEEVENQKRGDANAQIADLLNDSDLISFFTSPEALAQAIQSAISENARKSRPDQASTMSLKSTTMKDN